MESFKGNIEILTVKNTLYRRVLYTIPKKMQLVVMSIPPKEEIGVEIHPKTAQFIRVEEGRGIALVGKKRYLLRDDSALIVPPNMKHNIINTSPEYPLKLYTIYTPPEHPENTQEKFKMG